MRGLQGYRRQIQFSLEKLRTECRGTPCRPAAALLIVSAERSSFCLNDPRCSQVHFSLLVSQAPALSIGLDFSRPSSKQTITVTVAPSENAFHSRQLVALIDQDRPLLTNDLRLQQKRGKSMRCRFTRRHAKLCNADFASVLTSLLPDLTRILDFSC